MKQLYKLRTILFLAILLVEFDLHGETIDSLQKSKIRYFSLGKGDWNLVWNFLKKLSSKESSQISFTTDDCTGVMLF